MLVESAADLFEALQLAPRNLLGGVAVATEASEPAALLPLLPLLPLLTALGQGPVHGDVLATRTASDPGVLASQLLALELSGHVERLPGGLFQRVNR